MALQQAHKIKSCKNYYGVTCVNGNCPNALSNYDAERDDDAYAWAHLDEPIKCKDCIYNNGCKDCALKDTKYCSHEMEENNNGIR